MSMSTSEWYDGFAVREAAGHSPSYERLARAVAGSAEIIDRLDSLPRGKRQPNLLFACTRALGGPDDAPQQGSPTTGTTQVRIGEQSRDDREMLGGQGGCTLGGRSASSPSELRLDAGFLTGTGRRTWPDDHGR